MSATQLPVASRPPRLFRAACLTALALCMVATGRAQSEKEPQRGFHVTNSYSLGDIETINNTSGNMSLRIPLASLPAGRGGSPGAAVELLYNSKLWDPEPIVEPNGNSTFLKASPGGNWRYGYGYNLEVIDKRSEYRAPYGGGPGTCASASGLDDGARVVKVRMRFPDGGQHEFRPSGETPTHYNQEGYYDIEPDGRRYYCRSVGAGSPNDYILDSTQPTYQPRTYFSTDGTYLRLDIAYAPPPAGGTLPRQYWTLYLPDGGRVTNEPGQAGAPGPQRIHDRNGNHVEITAVGNGGTRIADQLGRAITIERDGATNQHYVRTQGFGGAPLTWTVKWKTIAVNKSYVVGVGGVQNLTWTFFVVESVTLPAQAGGLVYNFQYNAGASGPSEGWGELSALALPSGAQVGYAYKQDGEDGVSSWAVLQNHPTRKELRYLQEYDGASAETTETWQYSLNFPGGLSTTATSALVMGPDGGVSNEAFVNNSGHWDHSLPAASLRPDGTLVERRWLPNTPRGEVAMNPYVATEFTSIRNAAGTAYVKTAIKDYGLDKNGNVTSVKEYDWVSYSSVHTAGGPNWAAPRPAVKRETVTAYYGPTPDASDTTTDDPDAYHKPTSRPRRNSVQWSEVRDAARVLSRSEFRYDDFGTTGNLTEQLSWDSTRGDLMDPPLPDGARLNEGNSVSVRHEYDDNTTNPALRFGNRTLTVDANGHRTAYVYGDVSGPNGAAVSGLYPTAVFSAEGTAVQRTASSSYDFWSGLMTRVTDEDNHLSTATSYDALGRPTLVEEDDGAFDSAGLSVERQTRTEYADAARRIVVRSDLDATADQKLVSVRHFDQLGRVRLTRTLEDAATQSAANETAGIKVQMRFRHTATAADPYSYVLMSNPYRAARSSEAGGEPTMGWTLSKSDRGGRVVRSETFGGAALPAPFAAQNPNTNATGAVVTSYDAESVTVSDQTGRQRRSTVDSLGRLASILEAPDVPGYNFQTSFTFDALSNLTQIAQGGQTRTFSHSSLSRLVSATSPEVCRPQQGQCVPVPVTYTYEPNGNLKSRTDARGKIVTYDYDELNRVTSRTYNDTTPPVAYFYDSQPLPAGAPVFARGHSAGRLVAITYGGGATGSYAGQFDASGRPGLSRQVVDAGAAGLKVYEMAYEHDLAGNLKRETYPSGRVVETEFDSAGRAAGVKQQGTPLFYAGAARADAANRIQYAAHGAPSKMKLGNGLWEHVIYNSRLQTAEIGLGVSAADSGVLKIEYGYGEVTGGVLDPKKNNGNVRSQTITVPGMTSPYVQTYEYDSLNRLKSVAEMNQQAGGASPLWQQSYNYDRFGNRRYDAARTTKPAPALLTQQPETYNPTASEATNRLSGAGYRYDDAGNLLCDPLHPCGTATPLTPFYVYDAESRLTRAGGTQAGGAQYFYDGNGRRVKKVIGSQVTVYVYDTAGRLIAEYSNVSEAGSGVTYLTPDNLGSTRVVTGPNKEVKRRYDYHPFGEEATAGRVGYGTAEVRQQFTGKERDAESGLDYFNARYFSSEQGRFMSVDPLRASAKISNPQTFNRYTYVLNRPTVAIDPDGLSTIVVTVSTPASGTPTANVRLTRSRGWNAGTTVGASHNSPGTYDGLAAGVGGRDRTKRRADTPFGVYKRRETATAGGKDNSKISDSYGTGQVLMDPVAGEVAEARRSGILLHGGGGGLESPYESFQRLTPTEGCVRLHNAHVNQLIQDISALEGTDDALDRVFIGDHASLRRLAEQKDNDGNWLYPDLRMALGLFTSQEELDALVRADQERKRREEEERRRREEEERARRRRRH